MADKAADVRRPRRRSHGRRARSGRGVTLLRPGAAGARSPAGRADIERQRVALHRRRARAFSNLGAVGQSARGSRRGLKHLQPDQSEERCEILADIGQAHFWLFDIPALERVSAEALTLAEALGRTDLAAISHGLAGALPSGRRQRRRGPRPGPRDHRAVRHGRARLALPGLARAVLGRARQPGRGIGSQGDGMADDVRDATFTMYSLSHSALALAAVGRYAEAARVFGETRAFGRKYGVVPLLARAISMSAGYHFSLGDYDTAERIQLEARELARSVNFAPSIVSPSIDLLLIAARRHDPGQRRVAVRRNGRGVEKESRMARLAVGISAEPGSRRAGARPRRVGGSGRGRRRGNRPVPPPHASEVRGSRAGHPGSSVFAAAPAS